MVTNTDRYGFSTIASAENCINTLKDDKFNFWLTIFSELMPEVHISCTDLNVQGVKEHLKNFQAAATRIRNSGITDHSKISLSSSAKEVWDSFSFNVSEIFKLSGHLRISQLF